MRRFLLVVIVAAVAALAICYSLRKSWHTSSAAVTALLPRDTLAFAYLPDFNRTRGQWRQSDLYQIWSEPEVQDFLRKPRASMSMTVGVGQTLEELRRLEMKDAFIAITSVENQAAGIAAGFQFTGSADDAETIVGKWRARMFEKMPDAKRETVEYERHKIESCSEGILTLVSAYAGNWFLAANNLDVLKATLDRVDSRAKDKNATLTADETFSAAFKHMTPSYAALVYARVDRCVEKLMPVLAATGSSSSESLAALRQIRAFCGATAFDGGKIRDTIFVAMPKATNTAELTRATLSLGTKETFLYAAGCANLSSQLQPASSPSTGPPMQLQAITTTLAANGITLDEWNSAFGQEFSLLGDWPPDTRWPAILATLPIKDGAKARKIVAALTTAKDEDTTWSEQDKDGAHYFRMQSSGGIFSLSPTIALSEKMLIAGADPSSVESAVKRGTNGAGLAAMSDFRTAEREVGRAKQSFAYVDLALLYTRLDAALRPMLIMGAAFMPRISDTVDLSKLPAPEVITKHLSPLVMSQRPTEDGYLTESVGSITAYQGIVGLGAAAVSAGVFYQQQMRGGAGGWGNFLPSLGPSLPLPAPSPSVTPEESP